MKYKSKNNILVWGAVLLGGVFVLGTVIPIALNFAGKDRASAKFNQTISFVDGTKYGKYYDVGTKSDSSINQEELNDFWVEHNDNTEMQLGEIIYGITKFLPTLADSIPSYSYECTIYNYEHRVLQISPLTQIFQFKFWYEVRMNYHPKNPNDLSYTSGYRFYIDWTRPEIFNSDNEPGIYNLMYEKWYTRTPMFQDWELRFANKDNETHSLVFANQEFA